MLEVFCALITAMVARIGASTGTGDGNRTLFRPSFSADVTAQICNTSEMITGASNGVR